MATLRDEEIIEITRKIAIDNRLPVAAVSSSAAIDSAGLPAIEVTISITPGSSFEFFRDGRSSLTVSEVIRQVADKGEERVPIVHFEEERAS